MRLAITAILVLSAACTPEEQGAAPPDCARVAMTTWEYDDAARTATRRVARDGVVAVRVQTWDALGRPLVRSDDADGDGVPELVEVRRYGAQLEVIEVDERRDGGRDWRLSFSRDEAGRVRELLGEGPVSFALVEQSLEAFYESYAYDFGPPLLPDIDVVPVPPLFEWAYADGGQRMAAVRARYAYDAGGRAVAVAWDRGDDGTVDARRTVSADGEAEVTEADLDGDGVVDLRHVRRTDDAGRLVEHAVDADGDGRVDRRRIFVHAPDHVVELRDEDGDGVPERREVSWFDAQGRVVRVERDRDGDGRVDAVVARIYDAAGRLAEVHHDDDADGRPDRAARHAYDARGRLLSLREGPAACVLLD